MEDHPSLVFLAGVLLGAGATALTGKYLVSRSTRKQELEQKVKLEEEKTLLEQAKIALDD